MVTKRLLKSDVLLTPYEANKEFIFDITGSLPSSNCNSGSSSDVMVYTGIKLSSLFNKDVELQSFGQYQRLIYDQTNKLYYKSYSGSLITGSYYDRQDLSTITNERSVGRYSEYEHSEGIVKNFPITENSKIKVIQVSPKTISTKFLENTISLSSSLYNIRDDGSGNLIDYSASSHPYVGNAFYKSGKLVITNQNYVNLFPSPPTAFNKTYHFTESGSKLIDLADIVGIGTSAINYSTLSVITGSNTFVYNISSSYLSVTSSTIDNYYFYFNVQDSMSLCSNYGRVDFNISPSCNVTFTASVTSSISTQSYVHTFGCDYDIVKSTPLNCEFINTLQLSPSVTTGSVRSNGMLTYDYTFYANQEGTWEISNNGGLNYYTSSFTSSVFTGSTATSSVLYSNDFQGIVRFKYNDNFTEYYYKFNPIVNEGIVFDKINEYSSYLNLSSSCYPNQYKIVSNGDTPLGYNVSTTGDIGVFNLPNNTLSVIGTKGSFTTYVTSSIGNICSKTVYINGLNNSCSGDVIIEVEKTSTINNYYLLADVGNKYISSYPQWIVKSGSIDFKSRGNSLYNEIQVLGKSQTNILNFTYQDFCGVTYSKDFLFDYQYGITGSLIFGDNPNPILTSIPPTTDYIPTTTIVATTKYVPKVKLKLSQTVSNASPTNGEIVKFSMLVTNTGNVDATNVEVRNPLSSSLVFDSGATYGVRYTSSLVSAVIPIVKVNETIGVDYNLLVAGVYSSSIVNYSQIYYCDQLDSNSIFGNGFGHGEDDESNITIFIKPAFSGSVVIDKCISYTLVNNQTGSLPYYYYNCDGVYNSGSLNFVTGSNSVNICSKNISDISAGLLKISPNGNCVSEILLVPIIENVSYSCDCGNQFFDNTENAKGRVFINATNPNGDDTDLEYSFNGETHYQDLNFSNCLPNGLYTVFVRLKSDISKKSNQRVIIYCGKISDYCSTYRIVNNTTSSVSLDYINCVGQNITGTIISGSNFDICTRHRDYIILSDDLLNVQQMGSCIQNSSSCDISITSITSGSSSIQVNASSSINLVYTIDGGWSWYENTGIFSQLSQARYIVGVSDTNFRKECFVDYSLVTLGVSANFNPKIDFYQVRQDSDLLCNQYQSYIYCCITPVNTSGLYQYKVVDKTTNRIIYDWGNPVTDTVVAFLVNHGTYQVMVRDSDNLYCQNMFDNLVISFSNCV